MSEINTRHAFRIWRIWTQQYILRPSTEKTKYKIFRYPLDLLQISCLPTSIPASAIVSEELLKLASQTRYMNRHCKPMYFGGHETLPFSCRILPYRFSTAALLVAKIKIKKSTNSVVRFVSRIIIGWTWWHFINEGINI